MLSKKETSSIEQEQQHIWEREVTTTTLTEEVCVRYINFTAGCDWEIASNFWPFDLEHKQTTSFSRESRKLPAM